MFNSYNYCLSKYAAVGCGWLLPKFFTWGSLTILLLTTTGGTLPPAQAAETIVLKYSILRESIAVGDLSELSRTGEVSPALESYLSLAQKNPEDLRRLLNQSIAVSPPVLAPLLHSFVGTYLLEQVGNVIHTPSQRASTEALRGALITSAQTDDRISLMEILENYPTAEIQVEGDRLLELYQKIKDLGIGF
jgi:hypothetical protein